MRISSNGVNRDAENIRAIAPDRPIESVDGVGRHGADMQQRRI